MEDIDVYNINIPSNISKQVELRADIIRFIKESDYLTIDMTTLDTILFLSAQIENYLARLVEHEHSRNR